MKKTINWTCPSCGQKNKTPMHEPNACFVSMECEHCHEEVEDCLCYVAEMASKMGKMSARRRLSGKTKKEKTEIMKELSRRRWIR